MRLLALIESLNVNQTSSGVVSATLVSGLSRMGHEVHCLHSETAFSEFPWVDAASLRRISVHDLGLAGRALLKVPKLRGLPGHLTGFCPRSWKLVESWVRAIRWELSAGTYDAIVALGRGSSFAPHFALSEVQPLVPWLANLHDPYPVSHYPEPYRVAESPVYRHQKRHMERVLARASCVSFPSQRLLEWMQGFYPGLVGKAFVMPHLALHLKNLPSLGIDDQVELDAERFNLVHLGSLLGPRDPRALLSAFRRFLEDDPEHRERSTLAVIGKVNRQHGGLDTDLRAARDNFVVLKERVSYRRSLELLRRAAAPVVIEAAGAESPFLPGKAADYALVDRPIFVLSGANSELARLLGREYSFRADADDEEGIYRVMVSLWQLWKAGRLEENAPRQLRRELSPDRVLAPLCARLGSPQSPESSRGHW